LFSKSKLYYFAAVRIHFAFRGRVASLLGHPPCGVLPISYFPQESTCIRTA